MFQFLMFAEENIVVSFMGIYLVALLFVLLFEIIMGCICARISGKKGRSKAGYFFLGLFFNFIGLIITLLVEDLNADRRRRRPSREEEYYDDEEDDQDDDYYNDRRNNRR